jgi:predicted Zn-dependent protease
VLALVDRRRGNEAAALARLDELRKSSEETGEPPLINVDFQRGDILARQGRSSEAEAAFRAEIARFPTNLGAWRSLAILLADQGRSSESREALTEMVKSSGNPRAPQVARQTLQMLTR